MARYERELTTSQCKKLEKLDFSHNKLGKDNAWNGLAELIQADSHCIYELSAPSPIYYFSFPIQ